MGRRTRQHRPSSKSRAHHRTPAGSSQTTPRPLGHRAPSRAGRITSAEPAARYRRSRRTPRHANGKAVARPAGQRSQPRTLDGAENAASGLVAALRPSRRGTTHKSGRSAIGARQRPQPPTIEADGQTARRTARTIRRIIADLARLHGSPSATIEAQGASSIAGGECESPDGAAALVGVSHAAPVVSRALVDRPGDVGVPPG